MLLPLSRQGMPILLQRQINKLEISRISDMIWINLNRSVIMEEPCFPNNIKRPLADRLATNPERGLWGRTY